MTWSVRLNLGADAAYYLEYLESFIAVNSKFTCNKFTTRKEAEQWIIQELLRDTRLADKLEPYKVPEWAEQTK